MIIVTEKAKQFLLTDYNIKNFESVKYKADGSCMNFLACLETIVGDKEAVLDLCEKGWVLECDKKYYLISEFECPQPNFMDFEAFIKLSSKNGSVTYFLGSNEQDITCTMLENEKGVFSKYYNNGELVLSYPKGSEANDEKFI